MPLSSPVLDFLAPTSPPRPKARPATGLTMDKTMPPSPAYTPSARQQQQSASSSSSSSLSSHGMLSGSPFSSGQFSSSSQALASSFGSTQDNPIILSPDLSPVLHAADNPSRPPAPLSFFDMLDEVAGAGLPSNVMGNTIRASRDVAASYDEDASHNSISKKSAAPHALREHGPRSSTTTATASRPLEASSPMSRFAQSFPAFRPPQQAVGHSSVDAQPGQSGVSGEGPAQRSTSRPTCPPQTSITAGSDDGDSTPAFASARQSQAVSDDNGSQPAPSAPILTTRAGVPLWVESDNDLLCAIIQQRGLSWRQIALDFNEKSSSPRSAKGLQQHWLKLTQRLNRSPQIIAAMEAVADSSRDHAPRPDAWTEEELDILRASLAQRQTQRSAYADFQAKFTPSKRSWQGFRSKFKQMARAAREAGAQVQNQSEEEDVEECEDDSDPNELLSEESDDDEADADISMAASSTSAGTRKLGWSERDDRLLKLSVAQNRRGNRIDWTSLVPSFNRASDIERSQSAIQTRWYTVLAGDSRPAASSTASLKRKRMQRPSTPAPRPPRLRWTSQEHSVLRQILARYPNYASSHLTICDEFKKALPRSERSSVALLKKCRRLVDKYGGRNEEGDSHEEEEETDEEEGDGDGDVAMGEFSVVIPTPPRGTMRTRSGRRLLPLDASHSHDQGGEDAMDDSFMESSSSATGADTNQQSPQRVAAAPPTSAAEAQQVQITSTPLSTSITAPSAAAAAGPTASASGAATILTPPSSTVAAASVTTPAAAALPPAATTSIQIPPNFTFSTGPKGVRINGCFPGLEVVVFAGGHAQFFPHASTVPTAFDRPPLLHLRCLEEGGVEPVTLSQGVAFRTRPVLRRGGGATGGSVVGSGGGGGGGEMVVQTTFDVGQEFSVVLM